MGVNIVNSSPSTGTIRNELPTGTFHPPKSNPALYTTEDHRIYLAESTPLNPGPEDCVVHVKANGICGSDLHFWKKGEIGYLHVESDYILGHEGAGVILWVGDAVKTLRVGDRVAIEPGIPCGNCYQCSTGKYNLCANVRFTGAPPHNGSIRRYHVHPAKYLHKIPANLSFSDGALLEPLSVVLHGFERSPTRAGQSVLICGAGPIGLIALAVAKSSGAFPIIITDLDTGRLEFAKKFVPGCITFKISPKDIPESTGTKIQEVFMKMGAAPPAVVYECTGVESSIVTAAFSTRRGGEVMVIGVGRPVVNNIPFMHISMAEIDLKFINRYHHSWPYAIRFVQSGYINLKPLVTHTFRLEEAEAAMETAADRSKGSVKIHIIDSDEDRPQELSHL
ncbi:MAG: hypothetical protein M1834_000662 [Cirrosporium novae-zelandiae]|nr:MAG: hypothetical protein M1834_000662 [Cirrosporium novae-zelandiae]